MIKNTILVLVVAVLAGCAQPEVRHGYRMSWSCNGNIACINHMGSNGASGDFSNETDCLVWETAFINSYYNSTVTSCTYY